MFWDGFKYNRGNHPTPETNESCPGCFLGWLLVFREAAMESRLHEETQKAQAKQIIWRYSEFLWTAYEQSQIPDSKCLFIKTSCRFFCSSNSWKGRPCFPLRPMGFFLKSDGAGLRWIPSERDRLVALGSAKHLVPWAASSTGDSGRLWEKWETEKLFYSMYNLLLRVLEFGYLVRFFRFSRFSWRFKGLGVGDVGSFWFASACPLCFVKALCLSSGLGAKS